MREKRLYYLASIIVRGVCARKVFRVRKPWVSERIVFVILVIVLPLLLLVPDFRWLGVNCGPFLSHKTTNVVRGLVQRWLLNQNASALLLFSSVHISSHVQI